MSAPAASSVYFPTVRAVLRVVLVVVAVVVTLLLMYLVRRPLTWIFIAAFLAIALSGPITLLSRHMRRGFAVAIVYLLLILTPFALIGLLIPPVVTQANNLVQNLPEYAEEVTQFVNENERLRQLQDDYDITGKLEEQAEKLPARLGDAAGVLGDIGVGLVNSIFAAVTIIVLSLFILVERPQASSTAGSASTSPSARSGGTTCSPASATRSATTSPARCCRPRWPA